MEFPELTAQRSYSTAAGSGACRSALVSPIRSRDAQDKHNSYGARSATVRRLGMAVGDLEVADAGTGRLLQPVHLFQPLGYVGDVGEHPGRPKDAAANPTMALCAGARGGGLVHGHPGTGGRVP